MHDSQVIGAILNPENQGREVYADTVYRSEATESVLNLMEYESQIHERRYRNWDFSEEQREKSEGKDSGEES